MTARPYRLRAIYAISVVALLVPLMARPGQPVSARACGPLGVANAPGNSRLGPLGEVGTATPADQHNSAYDVLGYSIQGGGGAAVITMQIGNTWSDPAIVDLYLHVT